MDLFGSNVVDGYVIGEEIGHGTFSEVFDAKNQSTGENAAFKIMHLTSDGKLPIHVRRELAALEALNHNNIITLKDHIIQKFSIALVLERCRFDLFTLLKASTGTVLNPAFTKAIICQLLSALHVVHSNGWVHRDIAPGNVLFTAEGAVKLSDFGQTRTIAAEDIGSMTPGVGCRWYKAPELLFGSKAYTNTVDIWSVGCIFAELLSGKPLFPGTSDIDQICKIFNTMGTLNESIWPGVADLPDWGKLAFPEKPATPLQELIPGAAPDAIELLSAMLNYVPEERITVKQALEHAYFKEEPEILSCEACAKLMKLN